MCPFDRPWSFQIKHYSLVCLWGCFGKTLAFELVDSVGRLSSPVLGSIDQSFLGLKRIKVEEGGLCPTLLPFFLPHWLNWDISFHLLLPMDWDSHHWPLCFSGLWSLTEFHYWLSWITLLTFHSPYYERLSNTYHRPAFSNFIHPGFKDAEAELTTDWKFYPGCHSDGKKIKQATIFYIPQASSCWQFL